MRFSHLLAEVTTSWDAPILANRQSVPGSSGGRVESWQWVVPAKAQNEGFGRVDAGAGGPCCVAQGRDEPESFLKLTYQRTPAGSWADTTRKGLETISRN